MSRGFLYLVLATVLGLLAVFFLSQREDSTHQNNSEYDLFMPGLAGTINEVDRVNVMTAGNVTLATLNRTGDEWQVEQMDDYAANWPKLQKILAGLAKARVIEVKTDKPEYYSRLGVADLASESADGTMLELSANGEIHSVDIGHRAKNRVGQYVRLQSSAASGLIDQLLDVPSTLLGWVDKRIIDISASEVAQVEVLHPDNKRVLIMRISADQKDFDLADKLADRELRGVWAVNSLASTLSLLDMESVHPAEDNDWSDSIKMRVLLFSGVEIIADLREQDPTEIELTEIERAELGLGEKDNTYWLRLKASNPKTDFSALEKDKVAVARAEDNVKQRVADINQRANGWVYSISKQKFDAMAKMQEDLLKPLQQED